MFIVKDNLLFSSPEEFEYLDSLASTDFKNILAEFGNNSELINNGLDTAPSKRIKKVIKGYSKVLDGITVANRIGLQNMRKMCKHFNSWISFLENLK